MLFLVSIADKRVEIETDYGIASILSDAKVDKIIDTKITPQYKNENFDRGTLDGTEALISALQPSTNTQDYSELISHTSKMTKASSVNIQTSSFFAVFLIILVLLWFIDLTYSSNRRSNTNKSQKRNRKNSSSHNYYTGCNSDSHSDGSSFYSSGDSGGFGGGSSDGGGAGGDF